MLDDPKFKLIPLTFSVLIEPERNNYLKRENLEQSLVFFDGGEDNHERPPNDDYKLWRSHLRRESSVRGFGCSHGSCMGCGCAGWCKLVYIVVCRTKKVVYGGYRPHDLKNVHRP
ncbi:hypothetical protein Hanom_Chr12g01117351 [Helianthus anomalus]